MASKTLCILCLCYAHRPANVLTHKCKNMNVFPLTSIFTEPLNENCGGKKYEMGGQIMSMLVCALENVFPPISYVFKFFRTICLKPPDG